MKTEENFEIMNFENDSDLDASDENLHWCVNEGQFVSGTYTSDGERLACNSFVYL